MASKNWSNLFNEYKGLWVALQDDELTVITSGKKLPDVIKLAAEKGHNKPILAKIPLKNITYIG